MVSSFCGRLVVIAGLAAGAASCGSSTPATPTTPTTPSTVKDTFSGGLDRNGGVTHSFTAAAAGSVSVTLTALAPDETVKIGLGLGTWNGAACTIVIVNESATKGTAVSGSVNSPGNFCVWLHDAAGLLADRTTYTVEVTHP